MLHSDAGHILLVLGYQQWHGAAREIAAQMFGQDLYAFQLQRRARSQFPEPFERGEDD